MRTSELKAYSNPLFGLTRTRPHQTNKPSIATSFHPSSLNQTLMCGLQTHLSEWRHIGYYDMSYRKMFHGELLCVYPELLWLALTLFIRSLCSCLINNCFVSWRWVSCHPSAGFFHPTRWAHDSFPDHGCKHHISGCCSPYPAPAPCSFIPALCWTCSDRRFCITWAQFLPEETCARFCWELRQQKPE